MYVTHIREGHSGRRRRNVQLLFGCYTTTASRSFHQRCVRTTMLYALSRSACLLAFSAVVVPHYVSLSFSVVAASANWNSAPDAQQHPRGKFGSPSLSEWGECEMRLLIRKKGHPSLHTQGTWPKETNGGKKKGNNADWILTCSTHRLVVMIWFFRFCKREKDLH